MLPDQKDVPLGSRFRANQLPSPVAWYAWTTVPVASKRSTSAEWATNRPPLPSPGGSSRSANARPDVGEVSELGVPTGVEPPDQATLRGVEEGGLIRRQFDPVRADGSDRHIVANRFPAASYFCTSWLPPACPTKK